MRQLLGLVVVAAAVWLTGANGRVPVQAASPTILVVTSTGDGGGPAACPDAVKCTLRKAISVVNADVSADGFVITFDPTVFPKAQPATIAVGATPLPALTHATVSVDGSAAGVVIDGSAALTTADGLRLAGAGAAIRGLRIANFGGACIVVGAGGGMVGGEGTGQGNRLEGCRIGLVVGGEGAVLRGNRIGFAAIDKTPLGAVGVQVNAARAVIGGESVSASGANVVGGVSVAVRVGDGIAPAFDGVVVARNVFGRDAVTGAAAPLDVAVQLRQRSFGTKVAANTFANARVADIQVASDEGGVSVTRNTFRGNVFEGGDGMAIDLGADGIRNPNDAGDIDSGPNGLLNHPVFRRATQARLIGTACAGCDIELYYAAHAPGGARDEGSSPVPAAIAHADANGVFTFEAPPLSPGTWISALATDPQGNTSEFGPSTRVGAGVIQCGNPQLEPGWNHEGYFGAEPVILSAGVPGDPDHRIRAIYQLADGGNHYDQWLRDAPLGRTLTTLDPGEAYWFLVDTAVMLPGGFALNQPLSVAIVAGWNDIVYFGASADVRDALSTIDGSYEQAHRWTGGSGSGWVSWGTAETPGWARGFSEMEACSAYVLKATTDGTLVPLQP